MRSVLTLALTIVVLPAGAVGQVPHGAITGAIRDASD
jgi:hypothetical protein